AGRLWTIRFGPGWPREHSRGRWSRCFPGLLRPLAARLSRRNRYWPEAIPRAPNSIDEALRLLEQSIEQDAVIAAFGPFTNLALLEQRSPGILHNTRLFLMGGYVF